MFPVLEVKEYIDDSHWFLLCLNLRAQRFEVFDSIRVQSDKALLQTSDKIIRAIKTLWQCHHAESRVDISKYEPLYIDAPKQETT